MDSEQMALLLRRVRHDFANHLQVISGYLDMGQPERARHYLRRVIEDMNSARTIFEDRDADAALYFYQQALKANDLGCDLHFQNSLTAVDWKILSRYDEPARSLGRLLRERGYLASDVSVQLSLRADENGVEMVFSFLGEGQATHIVRINKE